MNLEIDAGEDICQASTRACTLAKEHNREVFFKFNDIQLVAHPSSYYKDICQIYNLKCSLRRANNNWSI